MKDLRKKSMRNGISSSKLQKVYGSFINYDLRIYRELIHTVPRLLKGEKWAWYGVNELIDLALARKIYIIAGNSRILLRSEKCTKMR